MRHNINHTKHCHLQVGADPPAAIDRDSIEEELAALLRNLGRRNHWGKPALADLLTKDSYPEPKKNSPGVWPAFKGDSSTDRRNLGESITAAAISAFPTGKYSTEGPFTADSLIAMGIDPRYAANFAEKANGSRARATWKQRRSVLSQITQCAKDIGIELPFPWADQEVHHFIGWLMDENKQSSTILQYISNIRCIHREMGLEMADKHWSFTKQIIEGHNNLSDPTPGRIPMTPELMLDLKESLSTSKLSVPDRRLIWLACTILFQASLRVGEILAPTRSKFCPDTTLTNSCVTWEPTRVHNKTVNMLRLKIRKPKETRGSKSVDVEVFELPGCFYSATTAFAKWRDCSSLDTEPHLPLFRRENGKLLTPRDLNGILKSLLKDSIKYSDGFVSTHSFRAGIVSVMSRLGYQDEEIKRQGRWSSDAFKAYCKTGRASRLNEQWTLATEISNLVHRCVQHREATV